MGQSVSIEEDKHLRAVVSKLNKMEVKDIEAVFMWVLVHSFILFVIELVIVICEEDYCLVLFKVKKSHMFLQPLFYVNLILTLTHCNKITDMPFISNR